MQMIADVSPKGYVTFRIYYNDAAFIAHKVYSFTSMRHLIAHFGDLLPLTECEFRIHASE